jgi:hypothetical protein
VKQGLAAAHPVCLPRLVSGLSFIQACGISLTPASAASMACGTDGYLIEQFLNANVSQRTDVDCSSADA